MARSSSSRRHGQTTSQSWPSCGLGPFEAETRGPALPIPGPWCPGRTSSTRGPHLHSDQWRCCNQLLRHALAHRMFGGGQKGRSDFDNHHTDARASDGEWMGPHSGHRLILRVSPSKVHERRNRRQQEKQAFRALQCDECGPVHNLREHKAWPS